MTPRTNAEPSTSLGPSGGDGTWVLLGTLGALVLLGVVELGSAPWPFRPPSVEPSGPLAPLVRASGKQWDPAILRTAATLAGLLVMVAAIATTTIRGWRPWMAVGLSVTVLALLLLPGVMLQAGLRQSTEPWFFDNDSTYQIDIAGDLLLDGENPYGHDYRFSGMERFYSFDGTVTRETRANEVALRHFAYFPGTPVSAAVWRLLPTPFDDYRFLVALATLAAIPAALLFPGPLGWRLAMGAVVAGNPLAIRAVWLGQADAPSVLCLLLAFGLATRSRFVAGAAVLGAAVLLKQFALVGVPFFAAMIVWRASRPQLARAAVTFAGVVAVGTLPFLIADPGALYADTIAYGGETYRIIGYGLAPLLLKAGVLESRTGYYPFLPLVLLIWLPVTAWLVRVQLRSRTMWTAAAAFSASIFLLFFISRVFQQSYLIWPLAGIAMACLLAATERRAPSARAANG